MSANLVSNIFKVAEVIAKYKSKFFKDIPSSKRGKTFNSMPTELERATKLAAEILSEKDKDMGGAFCPSGITKDNRDIVQAISDGLLDLKDAIEEYEKKRWKLFGGNKVLPKVNELTDRISKFFYMFVSSTTSAGSPAMDLETILTDPKAIAFWRQNIERSL